MMFILILNVIVIIWSSLINDESTLAILDTIDSITLYFYIAECIIKIVGLGFEKYFNDN